MSDLDFLWFSMRSSLLFGRSSPAFTLFELLAVIFLLTLFASISIPRLVGRRDKFRWREFLADLNNLSAGLVRAALSSEDSFRMKFKVFPDHSFDVVVQSGKILESDPTSIVFSDMKSLHGKNKIDRVDKLELVSFIVDGNNLVKEFKDGGTAHIYFSRFTFPAPVLMHLIYHAKGGDERMTIFLEPFLSRFYIYEGFLSEQEINNLKLSNLEAVF